MKFIFYDKSKMEMEIITDLLHEENISYKIKEKVIKNCFFDEEYDDNFIFIEELYDIICFTDINHFDFIKLLAKKRIKNRIKLERCFIKKMRGKNVQRVYKKNIANTNSKN